MKKGKKVFIRGMFSRGSLPIITNVLNFAERRNSVLANNLANIDTPFYKAQDLPVSEFRQALDNAMEERQNGNAREFNLTGTDNIHVGPQGEVRFDQVNAIESTIMRNNENTVGIDQAMSELSKNSLLHNVSSNVLNSLFKGLETAIRGRT